MTDKDYKSLLQFKKIGNLLQADNQYTQEYIDGLRGGSLVSHQSKTKRDLGFHRGYFKLIAFVWDNLPLNFREAVPKGKFYTFLKHLQGKYKTIYKFKGLPEMIEYESISFGRMNDERFKAFVKDQISVIYEELFFKLYDERMAIVLRETVEQEFETILREL